MTTTKACVRRVGRGDGGEERAGSADDHNTEKVDLRHHRVR